MTCCRACRSALGTCMARRCRCHRRDLLLDNAITYADPTANEAIANVSRKNKRYRRRKK